MARIKTAANLVHCTQPLDGSSLSHDQYHMAWLNDSVVGASMAKSHHLGYATEGQPLPGHTHNPLGLTPLLATVSQAWQAVLIH